MKKFSYAFFQYIKQYIYVLLYTAVCICVFSAIFFLYGVPLKIVWYPALLCLLIGMFFLIFRFHFFYKKHILLFELEKSIDAMAAKLPKGNLIEKDYAELTEAIIALRRAECTANEAGRQEMLDYYATWVHQIKAPIAVMRVLLQSEDNENNRALLGELFRIEQYAEMALGYIRLDEHSSDLVLKEVLLDDVLRRSVRRFAPMFIQKHIRLDYGGTDVTVLSDEKWLQFIIEQLLSNALKYTPQGEIRLSVDENKMLTIADSGIGIAPEDLPRIFEKGFTGYNGRADKKATGLGLYLCKKAADMLGHKITVVSEVGKGSAFTVDLKSTLLIVE